MQNNFTFSDFEKIIHNFSKLVQNFISDNLYQKIAFTSLPEYTELDLLLTNQFNIGMSTITELCKCYIFNTYPEQVQFIINCITEIYNKSYLILVNLI